MDAETIKTLLDLGTSGVIIVLMVTGFLVPKPFYEREVKRGDTATETSSKTADALTDVSGALRTVTDEVKGLRLELTAVKEVSGSLKSELATVKEILRSRI